MTLMHRWSVIFSIVIFCTSCARQPEPGQGNGNGKAAPSGSSAATNGQSKETGPQEKTTEKRESAAETVDSKQVIRNMADFYQKLNSFLVVNEKGMKVEMGGMKQEMSTPINVTVERPNKISMTSAKSGKQALPGLDIVSDGTSLYKHLEVVKKYTKEEAPEKLSDLLEDPIVAGGFGGPPSFVLILLSENPYESIMEGVESLTYEGTAELDGHKVHHLKFTQKQFDWELWVDVGEQPLVRKVSTDMEKSLPKQRGAEQMKMTTIESFEDWKWDSPPAADAFAFTAPAGSKEVDSLFGGGEEEEETLPALLGEKAPVFELENLEGKQVKLADHAGKDVVMVDMWATWCGPCRAEMPHLAEIAQEYGDKGVVFYAVNQREEKPEIEEYLKEEKLEINVLLDKEGKTGDDYLVEGIPTLALIDRKGVVQAVHIGYSPKIKETLRKELDALLEDKDLASQTKAEFAERQSKKKEEAQKLMDFETPELAWSARGRYTGVVVDDRTKKIYALKRGGQCSTLNSKGESLREFEFPGKGSILRTARLSGSEDCDLLLFDPWGHSVTAATATGGKIWNFDKEGGVDDVWRADLDGDGTDEVIIGYNGATGLHVLNKDATPRWEFTDIGNVWHVTAGDVNGDGQMEVVTTSATGQVHIFDRDGKQIDTHRLPLYANMIRTGRNRKEDTAETIFVIGSGEGSVEQMVALQGDGKVLWQLNLPGDSSHCDSLAICPTEPWAAAGLRGGTVVLINTVEGKIVLGTTSQGQAPQVAWGESESGKPLLLVATGSELNAFLTSSTEKRDEETLKQDSVEKSAETEKAEEQASPTSVQEDKVAPVRAEKPSESSGKADKTTESSDSE